MSYRDLRNFTEMMRALGYPRLISMENFRTPNFSLVAEILQWLVLRYDPNADIPMDVEFENDRVLFIKAVAQFMMTKAHIKLNTKRLYAADGLAVKEVLKVTSVLYNAAMKVNKPQNESQEESTYHPARFDFTSKLSELKKARQLASEITVKGSNLHELLGREVELRAIRRNCIGRPMDLNDIEKAVDKMMNETKEEIGRTEHQLENIASDEASLHAKIEKRSTELERNRKRLKNLESVRPAFMDEFEELEKKLQGVYQNYTQKYRNLTYLEHLNKELHESERKSIGDQNPLKLAARAREEHDAYVRQTLDGDVTEDEEDEVEVEEEENKPGKPKVVGSMAGGIDSEDDSEGLSSGSEGDDGQLIDDDDEEDVEDSDDNF